MTSSHRTSRPIADEDTLPHCTPTGNCQQASETADKGVDSYACLHVHGIVCFLKRGYIPIIVICIMCNPILKYSLARLSTLSYSYLLMNFNIYLCVALGISCWVYLAPYKFNC